MILSGSQQGNRLAAHIQTHKELQCSTGDMPVMSSHKPFWAVLLNYIGCGYIHFKFHAYQHKKALEQNWSVCVCKTSVHFIILAFISY